MGENSITFLQWFRGGNNIGHVTLPEMFVFINLVEALNLHRHTFATFKGLDISLHLDTFLIIHFSPKRENFSGLNMCSRGVPLFYQNIVVLPHDREK